MPSWPRTYSRVCTLSAGRTFFFGDILKDRLVQAQVRHKLLEPRVLFLQLLEFARLVRLKAPILLLPAIKGLFADPYLAARICHCHAELDLLEHGHDLLHRKPPPSHDFSYAPLPGAEPPKD